MVPISGECEEKDFFGKVVQDSDMIICTAQILYNAMTNTEETKHVELSGKSKQSIIMSFGDRLGTEGKM